MDDSVREFLVICGDNITVRFYGDCKDRIMLSIVYRKAPTDDWYKPVVEEYTYEVRQEEWCIPFTKRGRYYDPLNGFCSLFSCYLPVCCTNNKNNRGCICFTVTYTHDDIHSRKPQLSVDNYVSGFVSEGTIFESGEFETSIGESELHAINEVLTKTIYKNITVVVGNLEETYIQDYINKMML